jgi:16S rRNA (uracil1498-N3)-methyltransferase
MKPRFHCPVHLLPDSELPLPANAARHVQVLRMQPGQALTLFDGQGMEAEARITHMGRQDVRVSVVHCQLIERETPWAIHLALGMPANERMDWLVEKATELGVCSIQPLLTERTVLRLQGERATRKVAHWQSVAAAACEQCGRNRLPLIHAVQSLSTWLAGIHTAHAHASRQLLSLHPQSQPWSTPRPMPGPQELVFLSGPEGGFNPAEEAAAMTAGFTPVHLGPRVLRAETAALAVLAACSLHSSGT